jgi:hypothetical protein
MNRNFPALSSTVTNSAEQPSTLAAPDLVGQLVISSCFPAMFKPPATKRKSPGSVRFTRRRPGLKFFDTLMSYIMLYPARLTVKRIEPSL